MIGHSSLVVVIGPDLLGTVTCSDLGSSLRCDRTGLLLLLHLKEPALKNGHRFRFILMLRPLILASNHKSRGKMRDADRGVGTVDMLSTGTGCTVGIDL